MMLEREIYHLSSSELLSVGFLAGLAQTDVQGTLAAVGRISGRRGLGTISFTCDYLVLYIHFLTSLL
jgi:hypothetical protein